MKNSDTRLQIEHDPATDRMRIDISISRDRWLSAFRNYSDYNNLDLKLLSHPQDKIADLFALLADIFANDENEVRQVQQVQVEVIDRPLLQPLNGPETDVAN